MFYLRDIMVPDDAKRKEIFDEIGALCIRHQKITQSTMCRDFNRRAALLPERLEDAGFNRVADRAVDLLACCDSKDFSQCDSVQRAREVLERMRELAGENMGKC